MNSSTSCCCSSNFCYNPLLISTKLLVTGITCHLRRHGSVTLIRKRIHGGGFCVVKASMVEPSSSSSSSSSSEESSANFSKRMEQAWLISQQPRPVACSSCESNGHVECKWCGGTGFFILGDNMLCQVPSRSTSCVICAGKGSTSCGDCKGTGFRAKWLEQPPVQ